MSKENRFREYTRAVWQRDYQVYRRRSASWQESVAPAVEKLLAELRRYADEESLHAAYWEPGDWPVGVLLQDLPLYPEAEALLDLEHAAFWLRWQEIAEVR